MALRCLSSSADPATAEPIRQVLVGLGVEGEHCADASAAVERVTRESFQIVIIDWDQQSDARLLLTAARERKASERPLTLAMVSDDASVPQALQAGANSILRKPLLLNQVNDILTTARDLLRARQESATAAHAAAASASAAPAAPVPIVAEPAGEKTLRAGEFLHTAAPPPNTLFETESNAPAAFDQPPAEHVSPLKDLEPMAAAVAQEKPAPLPPLQPGETRGLAWYLNRGAAQAPAPAPPTPPVPQSSKPELLGFDQSPSFSGAAAAAAPAMAPDPSPQQTEQEQQREQKNEAALFSYMAGEEEDSQAKTKPRFRLPMGPIIAALALAACAIVAAPQAPWHPKLRALWGRGQKATHSWLNPQPVTPVQAPAAHEDFGRAGDEYKLPVAESIPDATTDPSQIRVTPVVDPTIKKSNNASANPDQTQAQPDGTSANPTDSSQPPAQPAPDTQPQQPPSSTTTAPSSTPDSPAATAPVIVPPHTDAPPVAATPAPYVPPAPQKNTQPQYVAAPAPKVPSSLKSQMASMTPDASGNKPPEAAMASIEPVAVPEAAERALLSDQPAITYPPNAKGQQGTVVLQILVGRDGTVQDAKFMQGSLAFARAAIDGVKLWKFKPYSMNGRPVSVQTTMTMTFKPGQ